MTEGYIGTLYDGAINLPRALDHTDNGKTLTKGSEVELYDGQDFAPFDYLGFPQLKLHPTKNEIYLFHYRFKTHANNPPTFDGDAVVRLSTDNAVSFGSPTRTTAPQILDPNFDYAELLGVIDLDGGGTRLTGIVREVPAAGRFVPWLTYSDDLYATDGMTPVRFASEFSSGFMSPSTMHIKYNGKYYSAGYARSGSSGTRGIYIWESDDKGVTNTLIGTVSPEGGTKDLTEPDLFIHNGVFFVIVRNESDNVSHLYYSLSAGKDWSRLFDVYDSDGRNGAAITPAGSIVTIGRKNGVWDNATGGNRTITTQSYTLGNTWTPQADLDSNLGAYQYGGLIYSPYVKQIIGIHCREYADSELDPPAPTANVGPTRLIKNIWVES